MLNLPRIYPITDVRISGISHAEQVERLIAGGAAFIQLREKYLSPHDFCEAAAESIKIARPRGVRIIINDRVDIALALKADGVHLGQDDLPPAEARAILGKDAIIGFSTHTIDQAKAAMELPIDYVAFGPVFPTQTKENPDEIVGLSGLQFVRAVIGEIPLVAIGGINVENLPLVLKSGADSAAMIGEIVSDSSQIAPKMRELLRSNYK